MSKQFYCMGRNLAELRKSSSTTYKCSLSVVDAKYFGSVNKTLSATAYCGREQTRFDCRKKSRRSSGSE
ncbi:unnamed protein product [Schistosoma curassoni]|uniref:Ovule protein n=1 Tax=Schistosoma curassoni TaxID=6186 RepID=A0A183L4L5_9TREM|nr:unnamed protein product [Schistosoma curassoni]